MNEKIETTKSLLVEHTAEDVAAYFALLNLDGDTSDVPASALDSIEKLSDLCDADVIDLITTLKSDESESFAPLVSALCDEWDLCETHLRDIYICADEGMNCQ